MSVSNVTSLLDCLYYQTRIKCSSVAAAEQQVLHFRCVHISAAMLLGYMSCFQVTEVQAPSSLPHAHGLHWRGDLTGEDTRILEVMQSDGDCWKLAPADVASLLAIGQGAISVCLDPARLRAQHPTLTEQQAEQVCLLAKHLQMHKCSSSCPEKSPPLEECSLYFPQLPSLYHRFTLRPCLKSEQDRRFLKQVEEISCDLKHLLRQDLKNGRIYNNNPVASLASLLTSSSAWTMMGSFQWKEVVTIGTG